MKDRSENSKPLRSLGRLRRVFLHPARRWGRCSHTVEGEVAGFGKILGNLFDPSWLTVILYFIKRACAVMSMTAVSAPTAGDADGEGRQLHGCGAASGLTQLHVCLFLFAGCGPRTAGRVRSDSVRQGVPFQSAGAQARDRLGGTVPVAGNRVTDCREVLPPRPGRHTRVLL